MNRTDRLLAIVLVLQAKKWVRAEDLARTFEVSKRTIYRDMDALDEAGIPIIAVPGEGFSLVEGYFLPPLSFSADEAIMLLLGADFVAQNFDTQYYDAVQSATQKIMTVLPDTLRPEVEYLVESIRFMALHGNTTPQTLQVLRRAILQRKRIQFQYKASYGNPNTISTTTRQVDPYGLVHIGGSWMLLGYCHLRKARRNFRLSRMGQLIILNKGFKRPADFKIELDDNDPRPITVRVLFDADITPRVQEQPSGYQISQETQADGLLVTFAVRRIEDILYWLLSWGAHLQVLEPLTLREALVAEAEKIQQLHQK